jgi:transketolase
MLIESQSIATRDAYGETLVNLGVKYPNLVVLEADISKSTRTNKFAKKFPERFFQFGVAEANMMAAAAGLATTGKIPFLSTYAVFASMRAMEPLRSLIAYGKLNVKIAVSHGGFTPANDGVTHQATEDFAMLRVLPGMTVIMPADYYSAIALVSAAAEMYGPVYLRFTRDPIPVLYKKDTNFRIGKGVVYRNGYDVTLLANGDLLHITLEAAEQLALEGVQAEVIDIHTIKPLDKELILDSVARTRRVVTIEDHQVIGGLGSAVAELLIETLPTPMRRIGLQDTFAESGKYELLLQKYCMDSRAIMSATMQLIK